MPLIGLPEYFGIEKVEEKYGAHYFRSEVSILANCCVMEGALDAGSAYPYILRRSRILLKVLLKSKQCCVI